MAVYCLGDKFYLGSLSETQRDNLGDNLIEYASEEDAFDALSSVRGWRDGFSRLVKFRNVLKLYLSSDDYVIGVVPAYRFGYEIKLCRGVTCVCISYPLDLRAMGVKDFLGSFMQYAKDAQLCDILPDDAVIRLGIAVGAAVSDKQGYLAAIKFFKSGLGYISGLSERIEVISAKLDTGFDFSLEDDITGAVDIAGDSAELSDGYVKWVDFADVCAKLAKLEARVRKLSKKLKRLEKSK